MQAAAEREHPASHAVHSAAGGVRSYLRLQHAVRVSPINGAQPAERHMTEGVVSPDLKLRASLVPENYLDILGADMVVKRRVDVHSVATGELVDKLVLPQDLEYMIRQPVWVSDPGGDHLLLRKGGAWFEPDTNSNVVDKAALLFLDVLTGECHEASLSDRCVSEPEAEGWCPRTAICSGKALVLALYEDADNRSVTLSVFSCDGTLVASVVPEISKFAELVWEPSGQAVALFDGDSEEETKGSVWVLASNTLIQLGPFGSVGCCVAWRTLSPLCLLLSNSRGTACIASYGAQGRPGGMMPQHLPEGVERAAWGCRLAVLVRSEHATYPSTCDQLQLYSSDQIGRFTLERTVTAAPHVFERWCLEVSADGELVAAVSGLVSRLGIVDWHLAVVHLCSGTLRQYAIQELRSRDPTDELLVMFSPDCSGVLVTRSGGCCSHLFSLC